jgi:5-methylcytosine-specific restriction protein A
MSTLPRPCLGCGQLVPKGSYCSDCGSTSARGYHGGWDALSKQVIREEGCCRDCGTTGTPGNPLTCDHIIPKAMGGTDERSNLTVRCRRHNSKKGSRHVF